MRLSCRRRRAASSKSERRRWQKKPTPLARLPSFRLAREAYEPLLPLSRGGVSRGDSHAPAQRVTLRRRRPERAGKEERMSLFSLREERRKKNHSRGRRKEQGATTSARGRAPLSSRTLVPALFAGPRASYTTTYLPSDDDDRREHVPETRERLVPSRDVAQGRRSGLEAVDERQHRLHALGGHCGVGAFFPCLSFFLCLKDWGGGRG